MQRELYDLFVKKGKPDNAAIMKIADDFVKPFSYIKKFRKALGIKDFQGLMKTPIGSVSIRPKSQFLKMKYCKENRVYLTGLYVQTLKDPLSVVMKGDRYFFYNVYKSKKGLPFHHVVVGQNIDGKIVIKTNYPISSVTDVKNFLSNEKDFGVYRRNDIIAHLQGHVDAEMTHTHGAESGSDVVCNRIIQNFKDEVNTSEEVEGLLLSAQNADLIKKEEMLQ